MKKLFFPFLIALLIASCTSKTTSGTTEMDDSLSVESTYIEYNNPPAEGFNQEGSDLIATLIADKTMLALGGREAWDNTQFISWNFFGSRNHVWNKWTGDVRIEEPKSNAIYLMNINTMKGKVQQNGVEVTDSLDYYLDRGKALWINDSYWLVMPFKLKDSGVTLRYVREDTTLVGTNSDVLSLTFEGVGVTPQNVYEVWVDTDTKLVTQWAYFQDSTQLEPRFVTAWTDYQEYGTILLSSGRGKNSLTDIQVSEEVAEGTFTVF